MERQLSLFTNLTVSQVEELVIGLGEPAYRARQLLSWVYKRLVASYDEMTDIPVGLRQKLAERITLQTLTPVRELVSKDGTIKTLFRLSDGRTVEAALMLYAAGEGRPRTTVCLSTQVGCAIGCVFCATGQQGFERNLTPGEMIGQVLFFSRHVTKDTDTVDRRGHITNLVFMGMGEPLANYEALKQAAGIFTSPLAFGMGVRNLTVSTAGLVPGIKKLAEDMPQIGLAVSLHAPDNNLRNRLVPLNKRYPLGTLMPACREYIKKTGRRISFEYILFGGINDSLAHGRELAALLHGMNCHVNLIPANRTANNIYKPPSRNGIFAFERALKSAGVNCTLRVSRGQDIDAGCGQLRSKFSG